MGGDLVYSVVFVFCVGFFGGFEWVVVDLYTSIVKGGMRWGMVNFWWRDERRKWFSPSWDIRRRRWLWLVVVMVGLFLFSCDLQSAILVPHICKNIEIVEGFEDL